jgi:hypothetical protein
MSQNPKHLDLDFVAECFEAAICSSEALEIAARQIQAQQSGVATLEQTM